MAKKKTPTEAVASETAAAKASGVEADHDRIVMASRAPDGTPAQVDPEYIGPRDAAEEGATKQLTQQKISAVDQAERAAATEQAEGVRSTEPDPIVAKLVAEHQSTEKEAERQAKAEVGKLHKDA